jgi:hypothetical protein
MSIIRFPVAAKLGDRPMARPCGLLERLCRQVFGYHRPRPVTRNSLKLDHARRVR